MTPQMTCRDIQIMTYIRDQTVGGKAAWRVGRQLREVCEQESFYNVDLTDGTRFDWKSLILNMEKSLANTIIGKSGIYRFRFRILLNKIDANYRQKNSRFPYRHEFEIIRCDGSAIHLHYHSNGRHDDIKEVCPKDYPEYPGHVRMADAG